jgi:hypothetical protein
MSDTDKLIYTIKLMKHNPKAYKNVGEWCIDCYYYCGCANKLLKKTDKQHCFMSEASKEVGK